MRTLVDVRLRDEAARFAFRFACDDCAHFDASREQCSFGYPASPRRCAIADDDAQARTLELCKAFELG